MDLKKLRSKYNLSQFDLAKKIGVSRFNISLIECGNRELKKEEKKATKKWLDSLKNK